jgi:hypothetical protein
MPTRSLAAGETAELLTLSRFSAASVRPQGGDIRVGEHQTTARSASLTQSGDRTTKVALEDDETLYAYAESGPVDIEYRREGFLDIIFPREEITVNDINTQAGVDIQAQSVTNLTQDLSVESSKSIVEVNADQTQTISNGGIQITTIRADSGELWTVNGMRLYDPDGAPGTNSFTVRTEAENVELAFGEEEDQTNLEYGSGQWISAESDSARNDIIGAKIDDSNGIEVVYRNNKGGTSATREIRFQFEVIQVA